MTPTRPRLLVVLVVVVVGGWTGSRAATTSVWSVLMVEVVDAVDSTMRKSVVNASSVTVHTAYPRLRAFR